MKDKQTHKQWMVSYSICLIVLLQKAIITYRLIANVSMLCVNTCEYVVTFVYCLHVCCSSHYHYHLPILHARRRQAGPLQSVRCKLWLCSENTMLTDTDGHRTPTLQVHTQSEKSYIWYYRKWWFWSGNDSDVWRGSAALPAAGASEATGVGGRARGRPQRAAAPAHRHRPRQVRHAGAMWVLLPSYSAIT